MKPGIPWSVKGIGPEAREAAKTAARLSGTTVGEWLNSAILDQSDEQPRPSDAGFPRRDAGSDAIHNRLSSLAEQLEQLSGRQQETAAGRYFEGQRPQSRDRVSLEALLARIEANEQHTVDAFQTVSERLQDLSEQVAQARDSSSSTDDGSPALTAVETALRNIVEHIEFSERRTHETFHSLGIRISEVAAKADQPNSASAYDPHALAKLDSQVAVLTARIEEVRQSSETLAHQARSAAAHAARCELRDIENRIEELLAQAQVAMRQTAGASGDLTKARAEIGSLAQRLDDIKIEAASERDVHALRLAIEQLSNRVAQSSDARPIAEFDRRLAELTHRLEQSHAQTAVVPQLQELEQHIHDLDQRLTEVTRRKPDGQAMGMLERQMEGLSERLVATEQRLAGIATIERSMSQLYDSLEQMRGMAQNTAEETASRVVQHFLEQMPSLPGTGASPELVALEEALGAVKHEVQQSDRQTQETLQAVHETLEQIVDKLTEIEAAQDGQVRSPVETSQQDLPVATSATHEQYARDAAPQPAAQQQFPTHPHTWQRAADVPPRPTGAEPLEQVLDSAQFGRSPPGREETQGRNPGAATGPPPIDDYIAAARRAVKTAAAGSRTADVSASELKSKRSGRFFPFQKVKKSRSLNGAAIPVEVLGSMRKRLILAGLLLLAAVSAYALRGVYNQEGEPHSTSITVPSERSTGNSDTVPRAMSPQSWLIAPDDAASSSAGLVPGSNFTGLAQVIAGQGDFPAAQSFAPFHERTAPAQAETASQIKPPAVLSANLLPTTIGPDSLRKAASTGDPSAQFLIAGRYLNGDSVSRNFGEAFKWYEMAAVQGLAPAQFRLAGFYEHGRGVDQDSSLAQLWYGRAAASGNVKAMHNLAVLLAERAKRPSDYEAAAQWLRTAAEHGLLDSQFNLGLLYQRGLGVRENAAEAYYWLKLAAIQGDKPAAAKARAVEDSLPMTDRNDVERRVAGFRAKESDRIANFVPVSDPAWQPSPAAKDASASPRSDNEVARVQSMLLRLGFDIGSADGRMSMKTANAIRLFQLQNGMAVNGEVGAELLTRLEGGNRNSRT